MTTTAPTPPLHVFKFIIRANEWRKDPSHEGLEWSGCVAAVVASTEAEAKASIQRYAAENGLDSRWTEVASVIQLPVQAGTFIAWAQY